MSFDVLFMVQHYILYRHSNTANLDGKDATDASGPGQMQDEADERTPLVEA